MPSPSLIFIAEESYSRTCLLQRCYSHLPQPYFKLRLPWSQHRLFFVFLLYYHRTTDTSNPLLESTNLPKFTVIEPSQLPPSMTSILAQLESGFENVQPSLGEAKEVKYEDVLPVI